MRNCEQIETKNTNLAEKLNGRKGEVWTNYV